MQRANAASQNRDPFELRKAWIPGLQRNISLRSCCVASGKREPQVRGPAARTPGSWEEIGAPEKQGRRECRVLAAPIASCAKVESTRVAATGSAEITRHSLRNGFNGFLRALPGDRAFLSPSPRGKCFPQSLTPASRRQDHTTSPSASPRARQSRRLRPPHPVPNVRDDRDTPLFGERDGGGYDVIWVKDEREYFCGEGWTGSITLFARAFFLFWRGRIGPGNPTTSSSSLRTHAKAGTT
jgi:hypothetical protein